MLKSLISLFKVHSHFIMLFLLLCICKAFRLSCVLTLSFHCQTLISILVSYRTTPFIQKQACTFSPAKNKNKQLEKAIQHLGFKAVVYAKHFLVTFRFTETVEVQPL